jgi:hypothetical protein
MGELVLKALLAFVECGHGSSSLLARSLPLILRPHGAAMLAQGHSQRTAANQ